MDANTSNITPILSTEGMDGTAAASVAAAATAYAQFALQAAALVPGQDGQLVLPSGVSLDNIRVVGRDLVIRMPDGSEVVVPDGAVFVPQFVVDGVAVPPVNLAALLIGQEPQPAAGPPQSSGGNFSQTPGDIGDPFGLGDLLPPTELAFPEPEQRELVPGLIDRDPDVNIQDGGPAGKDVTDNVSEVGLPGTRTNGNVESPGSSAGNGSDSTTGAIIVTSPDGIASITINGVVYTGAGQQITTPNGVLTLGALTGDQIPYTYRLTDNTSGDTTTDVFTVVLTDPDGDSSTARLTIVIADDVPTARNDTDSVAGGTFGPETGNVLSGAGTTSGAAGADTLGADGGTISGFRAGTSGSFAAVGTTIAGQYGTLTIGANGSYTYVRNTNTPGGVTDVFSYQLTDGDGDASTATLTINIGDAPNRITFIPEIGDGTQVREPHLPARDGEPSGSQFDGNNETTSGTITFNSPDGVGSVTVSGVTLTPGALPQTIVSNATGTLVITAYTYNPATGVGSITYNYTLNDNTLNTAGSTVTFPVVVTDLDGDAASDDLNINIIDDAPLAANDSGTQASENAAVTVNVITNDTPGADGVNLSTGVALVPGSLTGAGSLAYNGNGSFTYTPAAGEEGLVTFNYTITDGDGDPATAKVTITLLKDSEPRVDVSGENFVDEAGLPARGNEPAGSNEAAESETTGGTIAISTGGDTLQSLVINGVNVTSGGTVNGAHGTLTVTVSAGAYSYSYTLTDNTVGDTTTDSFDVVVTDSDGDSANDTLIVSIHDDVPTANPDGIFTVAEQMPLIINVFANDVTGADDVNPDTGIALTTAPTKGVVVDNGDGTFTYTPNAGAEGPDSFTYTITDGDGDPSTTTVTLNLLADSIPEIVRVTNLTVDEDGFAGANADNGLPGEVTSTNSTSATGTLVASFGADVPTNLLASISLNDSAALDGQLVTLAGLPVTFAKVGNDLVGSADGQEIIRISITGAVAGPGASDVTYTYTATLLQPVQHAVPGNEDSDILSAIGFTVSDSEGDPASGSFAVTVVDDLPTLEIGAATAIVTEGGAPYNGVWTLDPGADGMTTLSLNVNGTVQSFTLGGAPATFALAQGTLTFRADGTYTFQPNGNLDQNIAQAVTLTVSGADRDGDPVSDSITITINDGAGPMGGDTSTLTVNEAALDTPAATGSDPVLTTEVASDTLAFTAGSDNLVDFRFAGIADLVANIDGAGTDLFWTLSGDGKTIIGALTDGGPAAITIALTAPASIAATTSGTVGVTVTLADNLPHELALAAQTAGLGTVTVVASDQDGDSATGIVTVQVVDDIPDITGNAAAAATLSVDDTTLTSNATANMSSLFTINYHADGPAATGSIAYTLSIAADGTDSGVKDTATGQAVLLTNEAGVIVGRTATGGDIVFTVTVNATTGSVTLDQVRAVVHSPDTGANQFFDLAADLINLTATIKDGDGDIDSETVGISQGMRFFDDGLRSGSLSVSNEGGVLLTTQDAETIAAASDFAVTTANFSGVFGTSANYGNDLPGTTVLTYALATVGGTPDSGLDSHGAPITLYNIAGVITGSTAASLGAVDATNTIFTIAVGATTGIVTLTQFAEIDHAGPGVDSGFDTQFAALANNLVRLTGTAVYTDGDGDSASLNLFVDLGGNVRFADDGPALTTTLKSGALLTIDETNGVVAAGTEVDPDATGNLGSATIAIGDLYTATVVSGADGPATLTYKLIVTDNTPSGYLISSTNESINLFRVSDTVVEGRGAVSGNVALTFTIAANGTVTMTQLIAIEHTEITNHDETSGGMNPGVLLVETTATDFDNDFGKATVDLGSIVRIEDDGPAITNVTQAGSVTLDETGGLDANVLSSVAVIGGTFNFGSDGAATSGSIVYGLELTAGGTSVLTSLATAVGDFPITLVETATNQVTGRYVDGGGVTRDAFTVTIGTDGKLTVTQLVALEHLQDGDTPLHNDALTLNGFLTASVTIKDSDGDTTTATAQVGDQVTFLDDGLLAVADTKSVSEGAIVNGNVLNDAADIFGLDGPDATTPAGGVVGVKAGSDISAPVTTGTATVIETTLGFLTLNADGSYIYDSKGNTVGTTALTDTFVYTIRDADGDTSTTTLTITINPVTLVTDSERFTVNEAGIDTTNDAGPDTVAGTVNGSTPGSDSDVAQGTLAVAGATSYVLTSPSGGSYGTLVLNSSGGYIYTLTKPFDTTPDDNNGITTETGKDVFNYTATDANGNSVNGTITVDIVDDIPTATATAVPGSIAALDETATTSTAATLGVTNIGNDPDVGGAGRISFALSSGAVATAGGVFGADGANAVDPLIFDLVVVNPTSGLSVTGGAAINLVEENGVVVGRVATGTFAGQAAFAIAIDPTSGVVTVEQYLSLEHPSSLNPDDTISLAAGSLGVTVTRTDGDGDKTTSASADISGQIRFDDDGPTETTATSSVTVDEDELAFGISDNDAEFTSASGSLGGLANFGSDGAGSFKFDLSGASMPVLASGGLPVKYEVSGDGLQLIGYTGANSALGQVFTLTITNAASGAYTFALLGQLDHSGPLVSGTGDDQILTLDLSSLVVVTDGDLDSIRLVDGLTITVEDDIPVSFAPGITNIVNTGTADTLASPVTLDLAGHLGADGLRSVVFVDDFAGDNLLRTTGGTLITSGGQNIVLTGYETGVLVGTTTGGQKVFTVTLNGAGDNYTVDFDRPLDDGAGVSLTDLGFATAGNKNFNYIDVAGTTEELLFGGYERSATGATTIGTVNTNNVAIGVNNQSTNDGENLIIDFVNSPSVTGSASNTYNLGGTHYQVNNFSFSIVQVGGSTPADSIEIWVRVYNADDIDPAGTSNTTHLAELRDDPQLAITGIQVNGVDIPLASLQSDGAGGYLVTGLDLNDRVTVSRTGGYDRIEIENAISLNASPNPALNGESFDIGAFAFTRINSGNPLNLAFDVRLTDGDGDTVVVADAIKINTTPAPVVIDLDGDGTEFVSIAGGVTFDYAGNGALLATAWVGADDGLLAIDRNGDGLINDGSEIVFGGSGLTDLQGLAANYDSNKDGVLDASDADFAKFGVWQDANSNGVTDAGEFQSLSDAGITSINLVSDGVEYATADGDVTVHGTSSYTKADGTTGDIADASFATGGAAKVAANENDQRVLVSANAGMAGSMVAAGLVAAVAIEHDAIDAVLSNVGNFDGGSRADSYAGLQSAPFETGQTSDFFSGLNSANEMASNFGDNAVKFSSYDRMADTGAFQNDSFGADQVDAFASNLLAPTELDQGMFNMSHGSSMGMAVDAGSQALIALQDGGFAQSALQDVVADALAGGVGEGANVDALLNALAGPANEMSLLGDSLAQTFGDNPVFEALSFNSGLDTFDQITTTQMELSAATGHHG